MPSCKFIALTACAACAALPVHAEGLWLSDAEIAKEFHGTTIDGHYLSGKPFIERYSANGRVEYTERGLTVSGRWSVKSGTLCTIYDFDPAGGCFRVARSGRNCFEFYFASRTEDAAPGHEHEQPKWTARGSRQGEDGACPDAADV